MHGSPAGDALYAAEISAELGQDVVVKTSDKLSPSGNFSHGSCASSTSGVGIGELRKLFASCQRPKMKSTTTSTSRNAPTNSGRKQRRRRNSIRPGRLNSRKSGLKYAPGLSLIAIGESDLGSDNSSSSTITTGTLSNNKEKDTRINFATFVEFIIVAAEYFDRNPFVVTRSKISRFFKTTLFQKCKTDSSGKCSNTTKEDMNEYFYAVEAKDSARAAENYAKFRMYQMQLMKQNPYGLYRTHPDLMLARAKDTLFETLCRVALTSVQPLHLTLKKTATRRLGDDLQRLKSITGAVRTTKRSVFYNGDVSSSDEEEEEDGYVARKIDPPPGVSLIRRLS